MVSKNQKAKFSTSIMADVKGIPGVGEHGM